MTMHQQMMQAMSEYARSLPESSRDAPFIYSHRKGLALAILKAQLTAAEDIQPGIFKAAMERVFSAAIADADGETVQ